MKIIKYILALYIVFLYGCKETERDDSVFVDFEEVEEVKLTNSKNLSLENEEEEFFSYLFEMTYANGLLFINDPVSEYNMKIVDIDSKLIRKFGKRGRGPGEFKSQMCRASIDRRKNELYVTDNYDYFVYDLDSLKNSQDEPVRSFNFKTEHNYLSTTYCQDGYIVGGTYDNRFGIFDIEKKVSKSSYDYDGAKGALSSQAIYYSHPKEKEVMFFQTKSAIMGLLSISSGELTLNEKKYWISDGRDVIEGDTRSTEYGDQPRVSFVEASETNKGVYVLYSGKSIDPTSIESVTNAFSSKYVLLYDWDGKPLKKYTLDKEVRSIAIDESDSVLYAASYENDTPQIIMYKL